MLFVEKMTRPTQLGGDTLMITVRARVRPEGLFEAFSPSGR